MIKLFEPIDLRGLRMRNRIMVSPMCQYSAHMGLPRAWHFAHLSSLAIGGPGLLCLEATAVSPEGRITHGCLGLWDDSTESALAALVAALRDACDTPLAIQLAHAGRKASCARPWLGGQPLSTENGGWMPIAPSPVAHSPRFPVPVEMSREYIDRVVCRFADAACRAVRIGFNAVELHAGHGYLLHQFLSPISNLREDAYGGSREARMRMPLEVLRAVRRAVPEHVAVGVRISATDWLGDPRGLTLGDAVEIARHFAEGGADWIDVSSGGISPDQSVPIGPSYQVPLAAAIRRACGVPTIAVGSITEARQAESILVEGDADIVAIGRAMLYDPRWTWRAAEALGVQVPAPAPYRRRFPAGYGRVFLPDHPPGGA